MEPLFRIRDILVWIQILGSVPLIVDPEPDLDPASDPDPALKIKKSLNSRNQCFSSFLCLLVEGSGSRSLQIVTLSDLDQEGPKTYGSYGFGTLDVTKSPQDEIMRKYDFVCCFILIWFVWPDCVISGKVSTPPGHGTQSGSLVQVSSPVLSVLILTQMLTRFVQGGSPTPHPFS